jgi:UPF0755 protein
MRKLFYTLFVFLAISGGLAVWVYDELHRPFKSYKDSQHVKISKGTSSKSIARQLESLGIIKSRWHFLVTLWLHRSNQGLRAGEYQFLQPLTPIEVMEKLRKGEHSLVSVTFPEGLTIAEMAQIYERSALGDAKDFIKAAGAVGLIRDLDPQAADLEGYLFPETYRVSRHSKVEELIHQMVHEFKKSYTTQIQQKVATQSLNLRQIVTLASLIEKETAIASERNLVSAVFSNRLKVGMPLQCDPTVIYALRQTGKYDGNLTKTNMQIDSPYNTYRYKGIPPGPIASPSRESLWAALEPAEVKYLYFVARKDGSHEFSEKYQEHVSNVREHQLGQKVKRKAEENRR